VDGLPVADWRGFFVPFSYFLLDHGAECSYYVLFSKSGFWRRKNLPARCEAFLKEMNSRAIPDAQFERAKSRNQIEVGDSR
jgi:hypothetical protein